ncbi:MAG: hypothetical protein AB1631_18425 [Acidobacteriota bacterium]
MISDELGKQLHDRSTRGEVLTAEEESQLNEWYAAQDQAEIELLRLNPRDDSTNQLQAQVNSAITQLATVTRRIQEITAENDSLRTEIKSLHQQLISRTSPQPVG